jgi:hypothetical protein
MSRKKKAPALAIADEHIENCIYLIHGVKVMVDSDLAYLYRVTTKRLNEQVSRNLDRFPEDFMFQLTVEEAELLRSQNATSSSGHGGRRYRARVFTEHGIVMLSAVLRSRRAVEVSIAVTRAFIRLRKLFAIHKDLARRIEALEKKNSEHDAKFRIVFEDIRLIVGDTRKPRRRIGFKPNAQ